MNRPIECPTLPTTMPYTPSKKKGSALRWTIALSRGAWVDERRALKRATPGWLPGSQLGMDSYI
jgi:hypothetical protein